MAQFNATVTSVKRDPKNATQAIVQTDAGHSIWLQNSYITKVLQGAYLDDVRPTALVGAELEYDMKKYKAGDPVMNGDKAVLKDGKPLLHTKDGQRPENIIFGAIDGHITDYDKAKFNAAALGEATIKVASMFGNKAKKAVVTITEEVAAPTPKAEEPVKEKVEASDVS